MILEISFVLSNLGCVMLWAIKQTLCCMMSEC